MKTDCGSGRREDGYNMIRWYYLDCAKMRAMDAGLDAPFEESTMMTLDELKKIDAAAWCPGCGHPFVDHSLEVGCVNCECKSNHPRATRLALSDAIKQIADLRRENEQLRALFKPGDADALLGADDDRA